MFEIIRVVYYGMCSLAYILDMFKVIFFTCHHGQSPSLSTIWENICFFFQAPNKQIQDIESLTYKP